jgi:hypothetical protein
MPSVELEPVHSPERHLAGGSGAGAVGRGADEIGRGRGVELPRQIGGEYIGALQNNDEAQVAAAVIGIDPAGECGDPGTDAPFGNHQLEALDAVRHDLVRHCPVRMFSGRWCQRRVKQYAYRLNLLRLLFECEITQCLNRHGHRL